MPPVLDKSSRLSIGDTVTVAVGAFGQEYALSRGARPWRTESVRDEGVVVERSHGNKWAVRFADGQTHAFERKALALVARGAEHAGRPGRPTRGVSDDEDEERLVQRTPEQPMVDSSDDEAGAPVGRPDHDGGRENILLAQASEWRRDDEYGVDERARHGYTSQHGPTINGLSNWERASLFVLSKHFLPMKFLEDMAKEMSEIAKSKADQGLVDYKNFIVQVDDLLQWIGVWLYMLAFPQSGPRESYFEEPAAGYGPRHRLAAHLQLGSGSGSKTKGAKWFKLMHACFKLPVYINSSGDPFQKTRRWWDSLRDSFQQAIDCSWLVVLDESMVRWMGRGMPGLMVILRKPTPIGLELHTLCCALCGALVWFEVYEGKEAMAKKEFCDRYPKSVALTLRMLKPYFTSGRVVIADSWFGSVACALALFAHGIFAVMNVKTATKGYPKDELLNVVGEVTGNSVEARAARRARRGKQVAFVRVFHVGARTVYLTAGGHNKKVPLLLISSYGSMLPGKEHVKTWQVNKADGSIEILRLSTPQPQMHEVYRTWMNVVDVHNKLRQGVVSMADVWHTTSWAERHFAEGLGLWEVNVYKTLIYFYSEFSGLSHGDFRARIAWAFLTLGKKEYPNKKEDSGLEVEEAVEMGNRRTMGIAPLPGGGHKYVRHPSSSKMHACAYCGRPAYFRCITCENNGLGVLSICGPKASQKRGCRQKHADGVSPIHTCFAMRAESREKVKISIARRKRSLVDEDEDEDEE